MRRDDMADLTAFVVVAQEGNFTRAASRLGVTQSALSQIVSRLEERLGVRLLTRTTRSVATTEAGERLVHTLGPMLLELDQQMEDLSVFRDKPTGTIRITTVEHAAKTILYPKLRTLSEQYPDIKIEIFIDNGLTNVVAERFDAGVRLGAQVEKDMIAVRLGPDIPMAVVGSPSYFETNKQPRKPNDLIHHRCINLRLPTTDTLYAWRFTEQGRELKVNVDGSFIFNSLELIVKAVFDGIGLACLPLDIVDVHLKNRSLRQVLSEFSSALPAYHLYYPSRRHSPPAFKLVVNAIRYRK